MSIFRVEGVKFDLGHKKEGHCIEQCRHCDSETFNAPADRVSLCAHCKKEMFPCSACKEGYCSWNFELLLCHKFTHSVEYRNSFFQRRRQLERYTPEELWGDIPGFLDGFSDDEFDLYEEAPWSQVYAPKLEYARRDRNSLPGPTLVDHAARPKGNTFTHFMEGFRKMIDDELKKKRNVRCH